MRTNQPRVAPKGIQQVQIPCWQSASFWPMLCPGGDGFIDQVKGYIYLPTKKELYSPGKSNKAIFGNVDLTFRILAINETIPTWT
jgi:hypothetical protein